jgi:DNA mismatch repair ATPase MutS
MPKSIVQRANEILKQLEADNAQVGALEQDGLAATAGNGSVAGAGGSANNGSANSGPTGTGGSATGGVST